MKCRSVPYKIFLHWLLFAGLMGISLFIAWDLGVISRIWYADVTRISPAIFVLLLLTSLHCAYRSWFLSQQALMYDQLKSLPEAAFPNGVSIINDYLSTLKADSNDKSDNSLMAEVMAESLRGTHQVGWFISGLMIKLGLLGTVIGFVLMLSSVSGLDTLDISDIKQLMQQMTQGMGVAMNTTMVGLVSSMLLGVQYLLLDRHADQLVVQGVQLGEALSASTPPEEQVE